MLRKQGEVVTSSDYRRDTRVRIVISGPPKQGNRWLKCILASIYGLGTMAGHETPSSQLAAFTAWVEQGNFPDNTIFHQHRRFAPRLLDVLDAIPAHAVTIVRDPYDAFVSLYYWVQDRAAHQEGDDKGRPRDAIIGKSLDDPLVLDYLAGDYRTYMDQADAWIHSGRSHVVRYEALHRDPIDEMRKLTERLQPVADSRIAAAVDNCSADKMRQLNQKFSRHVRAATVGDSKQRLTDAHLAIFREKHADVIQRLGYDVR